MIKAKIKEHILHMYINRNTLNRKQAAGAVASLSFFVDQHFKMELQVNKHLFLFFFFAKNRKAVAASRPMYKPI